MIKGKLLGINKFTSHAGNSVCTMNIGINYNQKATNSVGFDYAEGICFGDTADQIYDKVTKLHLIDENIIIGGVKDGYHNISVTDIEKAK